MASIKLPDGSLRDLADGSTVRQLAESIGRGLAKAAIAGKVDGKLVDLSFPLTGPHEVSIITDRDPDGLYVMRHSTAHVLAQALRHLYGRDVQYTIGPVIENGFFYDFQLPASFSAEDLPKVEAEIQKIVAQDLPFSREEVEPARRKGIAARREPAIQGRDHRRAGGRRREERQHLSPGRLHRPVPRPPYPQYREDQGVQASERRRRILARRQQPRAAHADLRHRLLR